METKQEHYESMMQAIARYAPSADLEVIQRAYAYADEKHKNQLRKSGEPYIIHPLAVAEIVAEIGLAAAALAITVFAVTNRRGCSALILNAIGGAAALFAMEVG